MKLAGAGALAACLAAGLAAQSAVPIAYLSRAQAQPVFEALGEPLPAPEAWPAWIAAADRATRARVADGDDLAIVNFLLFGTSFTTEPRITTSQLDPAAIAGAVGARLDDFERALAQPGANERLQVARQVLAGRGPMRALLRSLVERAARDQETHARLAADARALGDPSLEFAERSRIFRDRGLASDTSFRINVAVEDALARAFADERGRRRVTRVAIVGPGLDFTDKQDGHDFYPPQTIQPFAVIDSLVRLGLADAGTVQVTTLDVSPRVNGHLAQARARGLAGAPYVLYAVLDGEVAWTPGMRASFATFGGAIAGQLPVTIPPGIGPVLVRALSVRPPIAARVTPRDVNITAQHLALPDADRFDLVIGTNVFVYYDRLEQGLAMASIARMLQPGGRLLSNNALVEVPKVGLKSAGYSRTLYSAREEDGDVIIWYRKVG